ncbi:MAG: YkgJ family cysteine cluster protein [Nitrosopumilus sp.]|nr:YkgJ family cysteine cluster protein [Nitrosopumilus sp.]
MNVMHDLHAYSDLCEGCQNISCCTNFLSPLVFETDRKKLQNNNLGISLDECLQSVVIAGKKFNEIKKKSSPQKSMECMFYDSKKGCTIYKHRPLDCRMFPFDIHKIDDKYRWVVYSCNTDKKNNWEWTEQHLVNMENDPGFSEIFDNVGYFSDLTTVDGKVHQITHSRK